jgi:serine/threonine-protein kinase
VLIQAHHAPSDPSASETLLREARAVGTLDQPNVARVLEADVDPSGAPFLVLEHLEGETLAERLRRVGRLPWREATEVLAQACEGLSALHERGVVHRAVDPSTLFLAQRDGAERAMVLGLGLASVAPVDDARGTTADLSAEAGVAFSSPDHLERPEEREPRADLWSVGVVLHLALTGGLPFRGATMHELVRAILQGQPARATELVTEVPEELQALVDECLRKAPTLRPPSARALSDGLRRLLSGSASGARLFRAGPSFRVFLQGRLFTLIWVDSPLPDDIDAIVRAAKDARALVGGRLIELVLAPALLGIGAAELQAGERMVERMAEFSREFDRLYMVIDADGFAFKLIQRVSELLSENVDAAFKIGRRSEILSLVSEDVGIPVEQLDRVLRRD